MKINEKIVDIATGKETIIERQETDLESKSRLELNKKYAEFDQEINNKQELRLAILEKLGLTTDEAAVLLG